MAYVVGIDLGTTNTVVAYAQRDGGAVRTLNIPQLVSPTQMEKHPLLPSLLFVSIDASAEKNHYGTPPWLTGEHARRRGKEVPGRSVVSAKSWLCHDGVDRTAPILPWGSSEDVPQISPVDASAAVLRHVQLAWDEAHPDAPLRKQEIVLTVPASFDEVARELTLAAAERAGLNVTLLEEPQAAFYDYLAHGRAELVALAKKAQRDLQVLVCDVGGGTTDLSLVNVALHGKELVATRTAVGRHILLGGDNMDLALAHVAETKLGDPPLDPARFGQLVIACRSAKERLLSPRAPESVQVTVLGAGAKLIGSQRSAVITKNEASAIVDGFLPPVASDASPEQSRGGLLAFGLPFERDPAITKHIAAFVRRHSKGDPIDAVLLNGGIFHSRAIEKRIGEVLSSWGHKVAVLPNADPDLAVARGAVRHALAKRGIGAAIRGGSARGYYIGVSATTAVCIVPKGAEENVVHIAKGRTFALSVGRSVRFELFASDDSLGHRAGDTVEIDPDLFVRLPNVTAKFDGASAHAQVQVRLQGELSPLGTLELACVAEHDAKERYKLAFQLRREETPVEPSAIPPPVVSRRIDAGEAILNRVFGKNQKDVDPRQVKDVIRDLEGALGVRGSWTTATARALFDSLIVNRGARRRSPAHERMFWLLAGFCVRPGFGDPNDSTRIRILFPLFVDKLAFPEKAPEWQAFFIAWRRASGGLTAEMQSSIRDTLDVFFAPASAKLKKAKFQPQAPHEMRDLVASLERIDEPRRRALGEWLIERTFSESDPNVWQAIGKIGARVPSYASAHHVVSAAACTDWLRQLLREDWAKSPLLSEAALRMARVTGDRARDIDERMRGEIAKRARATGTSEERVKVVEEFVPITVADRTAFFGDDLPLGLTLVD